MGNLVTERLKHAIRPTWYRVVFPRKEHFECPICGYRGPFKDKRISRTPDVVRADSKCLNCDAAERHRMMHLVIGDVLENWDAGRKSLLHIAPEKCLRKRLSSLFGTYHTADLFQPGVDFKEDIQAMSFPDASYDCVLVSRVLTIPPDVNASVRELRRILKPGGIAIIAEIYSHEKTIEFGEMRGSRSRQVGVDMLDLYAEHFRCVEPILSSRYDAKYQLANKILKDGRPADDYPEMVRLPGVGFLELVAVCRV
jgi:SAM-dependent methyltransferase